MCFLIKIQIELDYSIRETLIILYVCRYTISDTLLKALLETLNISMI